jgi:Zn-dependent protease
VVHELAHSVVARRRGATVREILLLPIGGVSRLEHLPETPKDEFAIAIAGPVASLGLAGLGVMLSVATGAPLVPIHLFDGALVARLAWVNLILAGFNLIPAFPMDGGRVYRSILERRLDLETATRRAARLGRVVAVVLGIAGFLFDLWLLFIAVFVYLGASAEEAATIVHVRLRGLRVADVMLRDPVTVDGSALVGMLVELRSHTDQQVFPVLDQGRYAGLIESSVLGAVPPETPVGALSRRGLPVVGPDDVLEDEGLPALQASRIGAIAVIDRVAHVTGLLEEARVLEILRRDRPAA